MREYIRKLQSKPEYVRKQILFGSLAVSMFLVGTVWITGLNYRFSNQNTAKIDEEIKPFALFGQTISDTYDNMSASVGNISELFKKEEPPKVEEKVETEKQIDLVPVEYQ